MKSRVEVLLSEPFRLLFPLGAAFGFWGVSHWLWYYAGMIETYSCIYHGLFQIQAFEAAFLAGFLMTALPRFMGAPHARLWEVALAVLLVCATAAALFAEQVAAAQSAFAFLMLHLLIFAASRYPARTEDPPSGFVLVPLGLLHGFLGAMLIRYPLPDFVKLGHLVVEQGMLLCLILAVGAYLGPRLLGQPDGSDTAHGALFAAATGLLITVSFPIESGAHPVAGRLLRAAAVTVYMLRAVPTPRPAVRLFHLSLLRHALWFVPAGLWLAAFFPDYDVVSLHVTFIGGFSLLTLTVASRVVVAHCGFEPVWRKNTRPFVALGVFILVALVGRLVADFMAWYYFGMLHVAAGFWMVGLIIWAVVFIPKMAPTHVADD